MHAVLCIDLNSEIPGKLFHFVETPTCRISIEKSAITHLH